MTHRSVVAKPFASAALVQPQRQHKALKKLVIRAREVERLQCHRLELDIMNLRHEIATLESLRRVHVARAKTRASEPKQRRDFETIVRELYELCENGYVDVVWTTDAQGAPQPVDVEKFVRSHFSASPWIGARATSSTGGLDGLLACVRQKTALLEPVRVRLVETAIQKIGETSPTQVRVVAKTRLKCVVKGVLLDTVFPHLAAEKHRWVREKLLGRAIEIYAEANFTFDVRSGLVVGVDHHMFDGEAILKLAESAEEMVAIMSGRGDAPPVAHRATRQPIPVHGAMSLHHVLT